MVVRSSYAEEVGHLSLAFLKLNCRIWVVNSTNSSCSNSHGLPAKKHLKNVQHMRPCFISFIPIFNFVVLKESFCYMEKLGDPLDLTKEIWKKVEIHFQDHFFWVGSSTFETLHLKDYQGVVDGHHLFLLVVGLMLDRNHQSWWFSLPIKKGHPVMNTKKSLPMFEKRQCFWLHKFALQKWAKGWCAKQNSNSCWLEHSITCKLEGDSSFGRITVRDAHPLI